MSLIKRVRSRPAIGGLMNSTIFSAKESPTLKKEISKLNRNPRRKYILITSKYESKSIPGLTGIVIRGRKK